MNKKGQLSKFWGIISMIAVFGIIIFIFLFFSVGLKQIIGEELLKPLINSSLNATSTMLTNETINSINNVQTIWDGNWFNYDLFFIIIFLTFVIELFYTSSQIKIDNMFSFFGLLTIGQLLFLFVLSFIATIRDWLITNLYTNLFDLSLISTPIIDMFISKIDIISFILFLICILISALDWQQIKEKIFNIGSDERAEQ